jgi:hypothetical protein
MFLLLIYLLLSLLNISILVVPPFDLSLALPPTSVVTRKVLDGLHFQIGWFAFSNSCKLEDILTPFINDFYRPFFVFV